MVSNTQVQIEREKNRFYFSANIILPMYKLNEHFSILHLYVNIDFVRFLLLLPLSVEFTRAPATRLGL